MISLPTFRGVLSSFSPLSLAPALWVTDNGSDPSVWTDMSGNGRHAVQATGGNQPSIETNIINGRQVRRFDGVNDVLIPTDFNLDNHTIFSVTKPDIVVESTPNTIFCIGSTILSARDVLHFYSKSESSTTFNSQRSSGSGGFPTAVSSATNLVYQITTGKYTGTEIITYVNNGSRNTVAANNSGSPTNKPSIGATIQAGSQIFFYRGDIAEIIAYPSNLSDFNCLRVERYLSKKYNIAIA